MSVRPRPEDTDDDLIRQNAEFLKNIKRKSDEVESTSIAEDDLKKQKSQECGKDCIFSDPEEILKQARVPGLLLCDIVEKVPTAKQIQPPVSSSGGFPSVFKRDKSISADTSGKKSVFAQMQLKKAETPPDLEEKVDLGAQQSIKNVFGPTEAQKIHEESLQKLSQLTEEQILEERRRLLSSLNPETLKFFANRGSSGKVSTVKEEVEILVPEAIPQKMEEETANEKTVDAEDFPINPEEAKKWLHMDVVEAEKLKWMKKLPAPKPLAPGDPYPARFDFEGNLLPANSDVPVTKALHHHGDEPERAGYTLEELLLFSRSSVMQQRAIGVTTIAKILKLAKEGRFDLCLEESIIPQLVGAGIFAILRFALDDSVTTVVQAAAEALANLLSSEPDEVCLNLILGTLFGWNQPILACPPEPEEEKEKGDAPVEEGELRDHELLQLDVVKGALRTDIVPRIRYLMEIIKPEPKTVLALLEILIRIGRHSRESALAVGRCPDLMKTIIQHFLPSTWTTTEKKPSEMSSVYGVPLARAMRLVRVLAAQSKAMASDLVSKYNIMTPVLAYLATEPGETGIPDGAAILMESIYLWQILLAYGLTVDEFKSFSPVFGRLISFHFSNTQLRAEGSFYQEHATALMCLLQSSLNVQGQAVNFELISGLWAPIFRATASWVAQAGENLPLSFSDFKLVGTALDTANLLFQTLLYWDNIDAIAVLTLMEKVVKSSIIPLLKSSNFLKITNSLEEHSSLLHAESVSGRRRDPRGLPSAGAVTFGQKITSVLQPSAPFFFVQPLVTFVSCAIEKFHRHQMDLVKSLMGNAGLQNYLDKVATLGCPGHDHWFSRVEIHLVADLLGLAAVMDELDNSKALLLHKAALNLVPCIRTEDKHVLASLFHTWVFFDSCSNFIQELGVTSLIENMHLKEKGCQSSISTSIENLPVIRDSYLAQFGLLESTLLLQSNTASLVAEGQASLPIDWPFLPLVKAAGESDASKDKKKEADSSSVQRALQWILILETLESDVLEKMLSPTARFCRLACIFLAENGLFLDKQIHNYLNNILIVTLSNMDKSGKDFDFDEKVPGLKDFWDLFVQLVQQFGSESYGDKLFAHFIFIPLQQRFKVAFKNLIWGESVEVIRFLSLPIEDLLIPVERFLSPSENDEALLMLYLKSLRSGLVKPTWSPILYKVATHHIIEYIKHGKNSKLAATLKSGLSSAPELAKLL